MDPNVNNAQAIIEAARKFGDVQTITGAGVNLASVPQGRTLVSLKPFLDELRAAPERKRGKAMLQTIGSFVDHVNRHKDADSVMFADIESAAPYLLAVYDYNEAGPEGAPRFGQHRAVYPFPLSDEWNAWEAAGGAGFRGQQAFAEFLEDRIMDVSADAGASVTALAEELGLTLATPRKLLELSRGLTINVAARVANHQNLSSGEGQLVFQTEHRDEQGAPIKVPGAFAISIPVLSGGPAYKLPVRLRYRVKDGSVSWAVSIERVERAWKIALEESCAFAAKETGLPLFYGTPEQ